MNKTEKENQQHKQQNEDANPHFKSETDTDQAFGETDQTDYNSESSFDPNLDTEAEFSDNSADLTEDQNPGQKPENEVQVLKKQLAESNDKYLRMVAEFDNFRKRTSKERSELFKTANKDVLVAIIPVMDDFERAEKALSTAKDPAAVKEGLLLISGKLKNILSQQGLKEMKSIGEPFDTDRHEAITNIPAGSEAMKGKVMDEVEKGYFLNDKVIRYAKVIVGE